MNGTPTNFNPDVPPTPKPLYPDTPWWAVLVAVLVTAVLSVIGTVVLIKGGISGGEFSLPSGAAILVDTITYTPHIILLFGVLADMFTYAGVYSIPSLIGVLSIFANYVFRYFWVGLNSLLDRGKGIVTGEQPAATGGRKQKGSGVAGQYFDNYDGCNVQGFEGFGSRFAPQTLVITATVFSYYIFDLVKNRGWINSIAAIIIGSVLFIGEAMIIGNCDPPNPEEAAKTDQPGVFGKAIRALAEGLLFGGTSYAIVQTYYPKRLPSAVISPFPTRSKDELSPGPDGKLYDADGYPWVVLPNGQTVPDISSARARKAFAAVASVNLGTGRPASQACDAAS